MVIYYILRKKSSEIRSRKLLKTLTLHILDVVCTTFYAINLQDLIARNLQAELKSVDSDRLVFQELHLFKTGYIRV